jgi:hypothetical protein
MRIRHGLAALALALSCFGAANAAAEPCELHIWPTNNLGGATMGSGMSGLLPALMAGDTTAQVKVIGALLDPAGQVEQIRKTGLESVLGLPADTQVVVHDPIDTGWKTGARNSLSSAPCYFELHVDQLLFNRHPLYGKDILAFFTFRSFGAGDAIEFKVGGRYRTKMPDFPKKVESDPASIEAVSAMINTAFRTDFTLFAERVRPKLAQRAR